jgi:REP element-mobilizing transposase RayT
MARANRLSEYGGIYHVTHRCHNREFLLKFARDRDAYRAKLREHLPEFELMLHRTEHGALRQGGAPTPMGVARVS